MRRLSGAVLVLLVAGYAVPRILPTVLGGGQAGAREDDPIRSRAPAGPRDPVPVSAATAVPGSEREPGDANVAPGTGPVAPGSEGSDETDPRTPPAGTPADRAAVFARLPVSPRDRAPVGAIGDGGIHVDRIDVGTEPGPTGCEGRGDRFSIDRRDRVHACFRVVHARTPDVVVVQWQRDGGTERRSRIRIPETAHGYRTRAALTLRREYVGAWRVRVLSTDGVELASHAFTVVE